MTKTPNGSQRDTMIADIHKTRERISDAFGGDIHAITADARKRQKESGYRTGRFREAEQGRSRVAWAKEVFTRLSALRAPRGTL